MRHYHCKEIGRKIFMKLRIRGSSLRLRLNQPEVEKLATEGLVKETVEFGAQEKLEYVLESSAAVSKICSNFSGGILKIMLPAHLATVWAKGDETGLEAIQESNETQTLRILIEKDFACLKPRAGEDDPHAFPHPDKTESC